MGVPSDSFSGLSVIVTDKHDYHNSASKYLNSTSEFPNSRFQSTQYTYRHPTSPSVEHTVQKYGINNVYETRDGSMHQNQLHNAVYHSNLLSQNDLPQKHDVQNKSAKKLSSPEIYSSLYKSKSDKVSIHKKHSQLYNHQSQPHDLSHRVLHAGSMKNQNSYKQDFKPRTDIRFSQQYQPAHPGYGSQLYYPASAYTGMSVPYVIGQGAEASWVPAGPSGYPRYNYQHSGTFPRMHRANNSTATYQSGANYQPEHMYDLDPLCIGGESQEQDHQDRNILHTVRHIEAGDSLSHYDWNKNNSNKISDDSKGHSVSPMFSSPTEYMMQYPITELF